MPNPRANGGWVTDLDAVLSDADEAAINRISEGLYRDLSVELAVVTIDNSSQSPSDFATNLFNHWGIGDASANNGLLVLMVMDERRVEMRTGEGLEAVLTDTSLKAIQTDVMVPSFKQGEYGKGLLAGITYVDQELRRDDAAPTEASPRPDAPPTKAPDSKTPANRVEPKIEPLTFVDIGIIGTLFGMFVGLPVLLLMLLALAFLAAPFLLWRAVRRRGARYCSDCRVYRVKLSESQEDEHLSSNQRHEEAIGAMDYDVYICLGCQSSGTVGRSRWFSQYRTCTRCGTRSMTTASVTLEHATYHSYGSVEITENCSYPNCLHTRTYTEQTPMLEDTSSDHDDDSFGGGSTSGGGAGSSW